MSEATPSADAGLVSALNRLLALARDAEQAYGVALDAVRDESLQPMLAGFRADHQRHALDLHHLVERLGGEPLESTVLRAGPFTWGMRAVAGLGGDREILSVLQANEEHLRDAYRVRAEARSSGTAAPLLRRHLEVEEEHFARVREALDAIAADGGQDPRSLASEVRLGAGGSAYMAS